MIYIILKEYLTKLVLILELLQIVSLGLSTGQVRLGLGLTWTRPDWIGLPKLQLATNPIYGSDLAVWLIS